MYYQYFGLTEAPFSIAVNPRYLFMSARHRDALAHLLYGVGEGGGFILLTGEVGTGKTTINRCLLEQLPQDTDIAIILNPALNAQELLASVCDEFGITYGDQPGSLKTLTDALHQYLLENHQRGRKTVLLIDEAQHLDFDVLEQIRLLTNLETNSEKLLQIILIGQPELTQMLARPELRQLNQRITARYNLEPLNLAETGAYISHRLQVAGMRADRDVFPARVVRGIHRETGGIPRLINVLCDRILLGAYGRNKTRADMAMLKLAVAEVMGDQGGDARTPVARWLLSALAGLSALAVGGWFLWQAMDEQGAPDPAVVAPAATLAEPSPNPAPAPARESGRVAATESVAAPMPSTSTPVAETARWLAPGAGLQRLWQLHAVSAPPPSDCPRALYQGIRCLEGEATTWDELARYRRPVVLELITPARFAAEALLLEIEGTTAWVYTEQGEQSVDLAALAPLWTGQYRLLWRPPAGFSQPLSVGDEGPAVTAIASLFAQLDGQPEPLATQVFNAALGQRVRLFQRERGLASDGVVGLQTLLQLNEALGLDVTPSLARVRLREARAARLPGEDSP